MGKKIEFTQPVILDESDLTVFKAENDVEYEVDIFERQSAELAKINNPASPGEGSSPAATYVYYPWAKTVLKTVSSDDLLTLRTNRNRELISSEEQAKLYSSVVGIAGMSVGSGIAMGLAYSGISREIKLADNDELDTSNLNRLRESLLDVGQPKAHIAARHIYELDPFSKVHVYDEGVNGGNIDQFFSDPKIDLVVDEIDDFQMKLELRIKAKELKLPLIMFTSLGDNILVDVERYDTDKDQRLFNGLLRNDQEEKLLNGEISQEDEKRLAVLLVGAEYIPTKALKSVLKIGTELVGRPQLYSTIAVDGGLAAYLIREILLGAPVQAGRYFVKFNELIGIATDELSDTDDRRQVLRKLSGGKS